VISHKISNHKKRKYLRPYFTFNKKKKSEFSGGTSSCLGDYFAYDIRNTGRDGLTNSTFSKQPHHKKIPIFLQIA
jgi:hypothetical protein